LPTLQLPPSAAEVVRMTAEFERQAKALQITLTTLAQVRVQVDVCGCRDRSRSQAAESFTLIYGSQLRNNVL
jgi:hypothetical protein